MTMFDKKNQAISDKKMDELRRRAEKANTESMFSKRNVERRKASSEQLRKRKAS
jgi:hypothetical protein